MLIFILEDTFVFNGCDLGFSLKDFVEENLWLFMVKMKRKVLREKTKVFEDMVFVYLEEEVFEYSCDLFIYWNLKKSFWSVFLILVVRFLGCFLSIVFLEKLFNIFIENGSFG